MPTTTFPAAGRQQATDSAPRRQHYRRDVQGLRAVAVLLVVAFHAGAGFHGGFIGVDVFFVISGFVITGLLTRELETRDRIDFRAFYTRRVRRLLPALATMIAAVAFVGTLAAPAAGQRMQAMTGLAASVFAANVYLLRLGTGYFDVSSSLDALLHTWTLAVEEQFYLVFPALLLGGWRLGRTASSRRAAALAVMCVGGTASLVLCLELARNGSASWREATFYGSPTRAWEFAAGAVVALASPWLDRVPRWIAEGATAFGLVLIVGSALTLNGTGDFPSVRAVVPVAGAAAVVASGGPRTTLTSWGLRTAPAVWIGDLSYSWYLWHWPLIVFARAIWPGVSGVATAAAAVSIVPAWLSFRYVETPFRRGRTRTVRLLAVCVAVPVAASLGLLGAERGLGAASSVARWNASQQLHVVNQRGCDDPTPLDRRRLAACTWTTPHAKGRVVLVGDSQAGAISEAVVGAAAHQGFDATLAVYSGCPFAAFIVGPLAPNKQCREFYAGTLAAILRLRPALVITSERSDMYLTGALGLRGQTHLTRDPAARSAVFSTGLGRMFRRLNAAGIPVLFVRPVPRIPTPPDGCAVIRILTSSCGGTVSRGAADAEMSQARTAEDRALAAATGTHVLSLEGVFCSSGRCKSTKGTHLLYENAAHLSIDGARSVTPVFERAIAADARRSG